MANSGSGLIDHEGIVQRKGNNSVFVSIMSASACSGCHANGACAMSGKEEKIIEVIGKYNVTPGDHVTILMKQSMGYAALFLGYVLPVFIVIIILSTLLYMKVPELTSGLASLAILIPYYTIIYFLRKTINDKFIFTLKD